MGAFHPVLGAWILSWRGGRGEGNTTATSPQRTNKCIDGKCIDVDARQVNFLVSG
jgi:hypothetical protein